MPNNNFESQTGYTFDINNVTSKITLDFDTNVVDPQNSVLGVNSTATNFILLDQSQVSGLGTDSVVSPDLYNSNSTFNNSVKSYVFEKLIDPSVVGCENCGDKRKYTPSSGVNSTGQITSTSVLPIINKEVIAEFEIEPEAYHSFEIDLVGHRTLCNSSGNCFTENVNDASGTTNVNKRSWFAPYIYDSSGNLKVGESVGLINIFDPTNTISPFGANNFASTTATDANPSTVYPPFNSETPLVENEYDAYRIMEYHCCKCCSYYEDFQAGKITESQARVLCEKSNIFIPSTSSFKQYDYCTDTTTGSRYISHLKRKFSSTATSICDIIKDKINQYGTMPDPNVPQCNNISFDSVTPLNLTNPNSNSGVENIRVEEGELTQYSIGGCQLVFTCTQQDVDDGILDCSQCVPGQAINLGGGACCTGCENFCNPGPDCSDPANACALECRPAGQTEEECIEQQCESNSCFSSNCPYYNPCGCGNPSCTDACIPACGDYNKCFYDGSPPSWLPSTKSVPIGYDTIDVADPSAELITPCNTVTWSVGSSRHSAILRNFDNSIVSSRSFLTGRCIESTGSDSYNDVISNKSCTYLDDAILNSGVTNYCALLLNNPLYFNQIWDDTTFNVFGGGFYANRDLRDFIYDQTGTIHFSTNVNSNFLSYKPIVDTNTIYHIEKIKSNNTTYLLNYGNKPTAPAFYDNANAYLSLGYGYVSQLSGGTPKQKYPVVKPYIYYDFSSQNYLSEYRVTAPANTFKPDERTFFATYGTSTNGRQTSGIVSVNTGNSNIPVTETTYSISSYSEESIIITGSTSQTDKSVLTPPSAITKEIKKIYTQQNYGVMLWEDNSVTKDSFWGKLSTAMSSALPSSQFVKNKYIDLSLSELLVMGVTTNNTLSLIGNDASIVIQSALTNLSGATLLSVTHTNETNQNFAFVIVDDGTGQNKGTVRGWGTNNSGRCVGTNSSNQPFSTASSVTVPAELRIAGSILTDVVQIETNNSICMALKSSGEVFVWGSTSANSGNPWAGTNASNSNINLTGTNAVSPPNGRVTILGTLLTDVKKIACGFSSYAALKKDLKTLVLWGDQSRIVFDGTPLAISKIITFTKNIADIQTTGIGGIILFEDGTVAHFGQQNLAGEKAVLSSLKNIRSIADSNYRTQFYGLLKNVSTSGSFINEISLNTWPETNQAFEYTATGRISRQLKRRGGIQNWNGINWDTVYTSKTDPKYPGLIYHSDITPINTLELANGTKKRNNEITLNNNEYIFTYTPYESNIKTYKKYLIDNGIEQEFTYVTDSRNFQGTQGNFENFKFRGKILADNVTVEILNTNIVYNSSGNIVAGALPAKIISTLLGSTTGNLDLNSLTNPIEVTINAYKFTGGTGSNKLVLNINDEVFDDGTLVGSFTTSGDLNGTTGKLTIILDREFRRSVSGLNRNDVAFMFKVKNNVKGFTDSITNDRTSTLKTSDFTSFAFNNTYTYLDRPRTEKARDLGRNEHELFTTKSARFATPDYASWDVTSYSNNSTENQMVIPFRGLQYQYGKIKPGKTYGISAEVDDYPIIRTIRKNNGKFYIQVLAGAFAYYHPLIHEPTLWILDLNSPVSLDWRNAICNRVSNWFNYVATTKWTCYIKHTQMASDTKSWQTPQNTIGGGGGGPKPKVIGRGQNININQVLGNNVTIVPPTAMQEIQREFEAR